MNTIVASILALLTECGVSSATEPPIEAPEESREDQHFCCTDVSTNGTGEGCVAINKENINSCDRVLSCGDKWVKKDGKVTCL